MIMKLRSAVGATVVLAAFATAQGEEFAFEALLSGDQEVPPNDSPATGVVLGTYDDVANTFSFSWEITDDLLGDPSAPGAHIHMAPPGENGDIVFAFATEAWPLEGEDTWTDLSEDHVDALFAGNLYFNFHTTEFPGGEIRGQIVPSPAAGIALLAAAPCLVARRRR